MKIPDNSHNPVFVSKEPSAEKNAVKVDSSQGRSVQNKPAVRGETPLRQAVQGDSPLRGNAGLASLLKLPPDGLSRSLIGFARFFSLPLEPKFLAALRRDALGAAALGETVREAAALGAAAAAGKGIKLGEKALKEYAAAIEGRPESFAGDGSAGPQTGSEKTRASSPENRRVGDPAERDAEQGADTPPNPDGEGAPQDTGSNPQGEGGKQGAGIQERDSQDTEVQEGADSKRGGAFRDDHTLDSGDKPDLQDRPDPRDKGLPPKNHPKSGLSAPELQRRITEILEERPLLDLINRIPGKNGRWVVIPFSFCENGVEFAVSLRILLKEGSPLSEGTLVSGNLNADIRVSRLGREQGRWLISLEKAEDGMRAELSVFSASGPRRLSAAEGKRVKQELAAALGLPFNKVSIREDALLFAESRENTLSSVNEEV